MRKCMALILLAAAGAGGCATTSNPKPPATPIDQVPMYGSMDRASVSSLKAADEKLIRDATAAFGSRERASKAWVDQGFKYYGKDDLANAMRRFNQGWLINPNNPDVYWGFMAVLQDRGQSCEAVKMADQAIKHEVYQPSFFSDAGQVYTRCGTENSALSAESKMEYRQRSEEMFSKATAALGSENAYTQSKWVQARYAWGDYSGAWEKAKAYRKATGKDLDAKLLSALQAKMPEPR